MNLRSYPKVELHRHLEGAVRFSTLIELARKKGLDVPEAPLQQKKTFLVQEQMNDLLSVLNKFSATQSVLDSENILTRITTEAIEDACNEGIKILELRYAPTFIQNCHQHLSLEEIHRAILLGVENAKHLPIAVGLICIFQRTVPLKQSEFVLDFVLESKSTWIGVDLADDEDAYPANLFQTLFSQSAKANLPITIHAGETGKTESWNNVKDAIEKLGAKRIGHGLQIIKDKSTLQFVKDRQIPLEICPTSNWLTHAIENLNEHPIRQLIENGILVTINSDDPGIFGIDLTNEYQLLHDQYSFKQAEFDRCNDIAAQASFISLSEKQKFWPRKINA